jgi:hypothetical protein
MRTVRKNGGPNLAETNILHYSFGCLAGALAFTHEKIIRHKRRQTLGYFGSPR